MARWEFSIEIDRRKSVPIYLQIARAITDDIRRGRLHPGDALPGTRTLARSLDVQRPTVNAAFDELAAEGWIVTRPARGAFVSPDLPEMRARGDVESVSRHFPLDLSPAPPDEMPYDVPRGGLLFAPNRPDVRLLPPDLIGRAYRRALHRGGAALLGYGRPQGHERLRAAVASMLASTRGIAATADDVCITRGSQMAIALLARAILRPGDVVAAEELTYRPAMEVFRMHGAKIVPIPVDKHGIKIEALEQIAPALRVVHVTPHHQFPTTVTLSAARRLRLLDLARKHKFAIIEEDYDHEFHYEGAPVLPLASADRHGVVAYVGTFSKVLAPALRTGYIVAPRPLLKSVIAHRLYVDVQGDRVLEYVLAQLMEEGEIQRQIHRTRREYEARRDLLIAALRRRLGEALSFDTPAGGIALWVKAADGIDIDAWAKRARKHLVLMVTAREFAVTGRPRPFARLGFASLNRQELTEAVRRLAAALV